MVILRMVFIIGLTMVYHSLPHYPTSKAWESHNFSCQAVTCQSGNLPNLRTANEGKFHGETTSLPFGPPTVNLSMTCISFMLQLGYLSESCDPKSHRCCCFRAAGRTLRAAFWMASFWRAMRRRALNCLAELVWLWHFFGGDPNMGPQFVR